MKISLGGAVSVTATERWLSEIRAGRAFAAADQQGAGGAGQFGLLQLFNPAASGVTAIIFSVHVFKAAAALVDYGPDNTARGAVFAEAVNLLSGGAASAVEWRRGTVAAGPTLTHLATCPANTHFELFSGWVIELGAGEGFTVLDETVNEAFQARMRWIEV